MSGSEGSTVDAARHDLTLHLQCGPTGPVELEVWDNDEDEVHHVLTEYPEAKTALDISRDLERAGYQIVPIEEGDSDA